LKKPKRQTRQRQQKPRSTAKPRVIPAPSSSLLRRFFERLASLLRRIWKQLGAVAAVAGIVGAVAGIAQYQHANLVDEREGKLGGQLVISVGDNAPLNKNVPTYFFFSMPKDVGDARYLVPVHLKLTNTSNAHDDEVRMTIEYDRKYFRSVLPDEAIRHDASRPAGEQHYEFSSDSAYDYVKYSTAFLSPHDSRTFTDAAFAMRMPYDPKAPLLFNSGEGLDVTVSTYSKGDIPRDWNIRYRGLRVPDDAGIEMVMRDWYAKQLAFEIRRETGFLGYLLKLLFEKEEVIMYGFSPDFRFIPKQNTFVPTGLPQQAMGYRVWPYHWKLLLHSS